MLSSRCSNTSRVAGVLPHPLVRLHLAEADSFLDRVRGERPEAVQRVLRTIVLAAATQLRQMIGELMPSANGDAPAAPGPSPAPPAPAAPDRYPRWR